ncbi:hypothetical protein N9Z41_00155 [bacterium]|nr:hypothetical protein [bacterium]
MKKSELTAFIKEEIKSTLSENTTIESDVKRYIEMLDELKEKFPSGKVKAKASALIGDLLDHINMNEDTQQDIKDTEELTKAVADLAKAKEEAGLSEENIGLADIEEMGYEAGERAFEEIKGRFLNKPDHQAYRKGFFQGYIDQAGAYGLNEEEDIKEADNQTVADLTDKELLIMVKNNDLNAAKELYKRDYFDKSDIAKVKAGKGKEIVDGEMHAKINVREGQISPEQFDDDIIDKKASKLAKKETSLAKAKEELAQLTKQMKSLARDYKEAEGAEKEKIVADLKKKTKLKKELEAIIDK